MEKQARELASQLDKARRNLVLLDPENIPTAQDEIRRLQGEGEQIEVELRKRPPSEADVNTEAMAVLRSLYWLAIFFRLTADPQPDDPEEMMEQGVTCTLTGDFRPVLNQYLRQISAITVHTSKGGWGNGTRHVFERGEISFDRVGLVRNNLNSDLPGKSRECCR